MSFFFLEKRQLKIARVRGGMTRKKWWEIGWLPISFASRHFCQLAFSQHHSWAQKRRRFNPPTTVAGDTPGGGVRPLQCGGGGRGILDRTAGAAPGLYQLLRRWQGAGGWQPMWWPSNRLEFKETAAQSLSIVNHHYEFFKFKKKIVLISFIRKLTAFRAMSTVLFMFRLCSVWQL